MPLAQDISLDLTSDHQPWTQRLGLLASSPLETADASVPGGDPLPDLFDGLVIRHISPDEIEQAQLTFNEAGLYSALQAFAKAWARSTCRAATVLDLCSATGLCSLRVAEIIAVRSVTLLDIDREALVQAERHFRHLEHYCSITADAVAMCPSGHFDLILMNSAYHHIEDERKAAFLQNASRLLSPDGLILMGDHFLPPYSDRRQFRQRVVDFYRDMISELQRRNEPPAAVEVIRQAAYHCWSGKIEYKVAFSHLRRDLAALAPLPLEILAAQTVWTPAVCVSTAEPTGSIALAIGPPTIRQFLLQDDRQDVAAWQP